MVYLRRLVWFIGRNLIWLCVILGVLVCGFYMCLNTANIYVILTDGLEKRVDAILTREDAEKLGMYFHADFLSNDDALEGAFDGTSVYSDYVISDFEYDLKIEKLWADKKLCEQYSKNCKDISFDTIDEYYEKIMKVYQ